MYVEEEPLKYETIMITLNKIKYLNGRVINTSTEYQPNLQYKAINEYITFTKENIINKDL